MSYQWAYSMAPGTMNNGTRSGFSDFFGDVAETTANIPGIGLATNEVSDFIGDAEDAFTSPEGTTFWDGFSEGIEIFIPGVVEDIGDGGGLDDLGGVLPGPVNDVVNGDGYTIPFVGTVGPNAPSGAPQQPPIPPTAAGPPGTTNGSGTVLGPNGQPIYTPSSCLNPNPTWAETPYFAEREAACKTEHLIMKTFQGWIEEKEQELEDLKQKFDERVVRFQDEGCCNVPMDEAPEEEIIFDSDHGPSSGGCGCGCSGGTVAAVAPCGCGGHGSHDNTVSTPSASSRSASMRSGTRTPTRSGTRSSTRSSPMETDPEPVSSSTSPSSETCSAAGTKMESCKRGGTVADCSAAGTVLESCKRKTKRGTVRPRPSSSSSICGRPAKRRRTEPASRKRSRPASICDAPPAKRRTDTAPANKKKRKVVKRRVETRKRKTKQKCS